MFVLNKEYYGNMVMPTAYKSLEIAAKEFTNFKLSSLGKKFSEVVNFVKTYI